MFSWAHLGLVVLGGALGTAARAGLAVVFDVPLGVLVVPLVNVCGAFALGVLTGVLLRRAETPASRSLRMFLGTGVLGGFTTYSALAVESAGSPLLFGLGMAGALGGTLAAWAGIVLARPRGAAR
ncbi:fluoride efflux transporter FluC [Microbacterium sp. RD1]|uniref:fluoride efflux transporter FluC n=1 Tax=Microbacterium sp. RD1 TaxID=3457313 RepID=UPI003FA53560